MSTSATIPVFDPQGSLRDIPEGMLAQAVKAGGMPAVRFQAPDKSIRFVPANRTQDATKAGGQILPFEQQDVKHPGFWATLYDDAKGFLTPRGFTPYPGMGQDEKAAAAGTAFEQDQARKAQGYSPAYRAAVPLAESVGVNVPGMEESAKQGDEGGVMGHAAAPIAAGATVATMARLGPELADTFSESAADAAKRISKLTPKQAGQAVGATTGAGLGHGALSVPGAYYGAKGAGAMVESVLGKDRANAPIFGKTETRAPLDPDELDATGENKPYAGAPPPIKRPANYYDATGENKPFAGGVDELRIPARTEAAPPAAAPAKAPGQAGSLVDSVAKPAVSEIPDRYNGEALNDARLRELEQSNDPMLAKLRANAASLPADEPAAATVKTSAKKSTVRIPAPDEDLVGILQDSLKHFQAKQAANQ